MVVTVIGTTVASGIPIITIKSVVKDTSVTIYGYNFPKDQTFTVRMGKYGTLALGGTVVGTKEASAITDFTATYTIPAALAGLDRIAIRLDSPQGFYSFNWFYNNPSGSSSTPVAPGYTGYPTFNISEVEKGVSVSVATSNMPADEKFTVRMGEYGTLGVGGIEVGTLDTGKGGALTAKFNIPAALADRARIAIRMDSSTGYYYAFNWFYNNTTGTSTSPAPTPVPGYVGIPTFTIASVVKDTSVSISGKNFPADQVFTVKMGEYGTLGVGGVVVGSYSSGTGGSFSASYPIPTALRGDAQIAIRLETANGYFYAFNWFYNNTTN